MYYYLHLIWPIRDVVHCWILPPSHLSFTWLPGFLPTSLAVPYPSLLVVPVSHFLLNLLGSLSSYTPSLHALVLAYGFHNFDMLMAPLFISPVPASLTSPHGCLMVSRTNATRTEPWTFPHHVFPISVNGSSNFLGGQAMLASANPAGSAFNKYPESNPFPLLLAWSKPASSLTWIIATTSYLASLLLASSHYSAHSSQILSLL